MVKIISVRQPWAYLIVAGYKPVENRTWNTSYRGPLLIHASQAMDPDDFPVQRKWIKESGIVIPEDLPRGAIVGAATLTDVWGMHGVIDYGGDEEIPGDYPRIQTPHERKIYRSPWFEGPYGFEMEYAVPFHQPIPYRGQLGIREASDALAARVSKMIAEARLCK